MWSAFAHWAHYIHITGYILNVSDFCPLDTLWSLIDWILNIFSMCPLIIGALAPSVTKFAKSKTAPKVIVKVRLPHLRVHRCRSSEVPWDSPSKERWTHLGLVVGGQSGPRSIERRLGQSWMWNFWKGSWSWSLFPARLTCGLDSS